MQWISIKNVSSWHKNFTLSLIMKSKSIEHYFMSTVKCNLWGLIVIILSQHFPSAAVKKIDTNWVKLLAPRLMTDTQQKGRKRNKKKRVATFTAMSIDAAFVFPPVFPHFSRFYYIFPFFLRYFYCWNFGQLETIFRRQPPFASALQLPRLIAKTLNCSYRGHMKSQRQHHPHFPASQFCHPADREKEKFARESFIFEPIMTVWQKRWLLWQLGALRGWKSGGSDGKIGGGGGS